VWFFTAFADIEF
jgi:hypothetical protein